MSDSNSDYRKLESALVEEVENKLQPRPSQLSLLPQPTPLNPYRFVTLPKDYD